MKSVSNAMTPYHAFLTVLASRKRDLFLDLHQKRWTIPMAVLKCKSCKAVFVFVRVLGWLFRSGPPDSLSVL